MADRFAADDIAIFDAARVPNFTFEVTWSPGRFQNIAQTVSDELVSVDGLSFRLMNLDPGSTSRIHYPGCRVTVTGEDDFFDTYYFRNSKEVKRSKFIIEMSTPASGTIMTLWLAVQSYVRNDDGTLTFDCQHPLVEWERRSMRDGDATTVVSNLIP